MMSCLSSDQILLALKGCSVPSNCFTCFSHLHHQPWIHPPCKASHKLPSRKYHYPVKKFKYYTKATSTHSRQKRHAGQGDPKNLGVSATTESTPSGAAQGPSTTALSPQSSEITSSGISIYADSFLKNKNKTLKKKVFRLRRQLVELQQHHSLVDLDKLESLARDHKDVLVKFIKLEEEKKRLEKTIESMKAKDQLQSHPHHVEIEKNAVISSDTKLKHLAEQNNQTQRGTTSVPSERASSKVDSTGVQCNLLDVDELRAVWSDEKEASEQRLLEHYHWKLTEVQQIYGDVVQKYSEECKQLMKSHEAEKFSLMEQLSALRTELDAATRVIPSSLDGRNDVTGELQGRAESSGAEANLTVDHLRSLLEKWALTISDQTRDTEMKLLHRSIEDSLTKMLDALQQQNNIAVECRELGTLCEHLKEENKNLHLKYEEEMHSKSELQEKLIVSEKKLSEIEKECLQHRMKAEELESRLERDVSSKDVALKKLTSDADSLRAQLSRSQSELKSVTSARLKLETALSERVRALSALNQQLEERITENCSLNTKLEERSAQLARAEASLAETQTKLNSILSENRSKLLELQDNVRSITAAKESEERAYQSQIRQLKVEVDQMKVRNETFQRQLAAITSTYNHMFGAATDASDNNST